MMHGDLSQDGGYPGPVLGIGKFVGVTGILPLWDHTHRRILTDETGTEGGSLSISSSLKSALIAWNDRYVDENPADELAYHLEGRELAARLSAEVGEPFTVILYPLYDT